MKAARLIGLVLVAAAALAGGQSRPEAATGQTHPLQLSVLIDVSWTTHPMPNKWSTDKFVNGLSAENIGRGLARLFNLLSPGDMVRISTFNGPPTFLTPFTSDRPTLDRAVKQFEALTSADRYGPSPIWDALVATAEAPPTSADGRVLPHVILLITDGRATSNRLQLNSAIDRLVALNTIVCVIGIPARVEFSGGGRVFVVDPAPFLKRVADATGGLHLEYYRPDNHVFPLFERIVRHLRSRQVP